MTNGLGFVGGVAEYSNLIRDIYLKYKLLRLNFLISLLGLLLSLRAL